jgi:hypothetical protein
MQVDKLGAYLKDPPLTKTARSSKKPRMLPQEPSSIQTKMKVLGQYIGFCVKWLHLDATMEWVMRPLVVAKFLGFQEAKGNKPSTINKVGASWCGWG